MPKGIYASIENYLTDLHDSGEIHVNDGDCDIVADHIVDAVKGLTDPDEIRGAVKQACYEDADAGMLGHPEIHPDIAAIVLAAHR